MKLQRTSMIALLIVAVAATISQADEKAKKESVVDGKDKHPIYSQTMKSLTGKKIDLKKYQGKVLLMVNVASECGATPQYGPLQRLHTKYGQAGLVVLGFPCNQFGAQEPGTNKEIAQFCKKNYGVSFTMFGKIDVNGEKSAPLYKHLTGKNSGLKGDDVGKVGWNFEKFLISREGKVVARFRTNADPDSVEFVNRVEEELNRKVPKKK